MASDSEVYLDYLHVFSQPENHNGYYHLWANDEDEREYAYRFRITDDDATAPVFSGYLLYKSIPLPIGTDYRKFRDYVRETLQETEQMDMRWGLAYKIDIETVPQQLIAGYSIWLQEKERRQREYELKEYQSRTKGQFNLF